MILGIIPSVCSDTQLLRAETTGRVGQLLLEHLGVKDALAFADKFLENLPLRVGPYAVGDGALRGAAQTVL